VATLLGSWQEFLRFLINTGITVALLTSLGNAIAKQGKWILLAEAAEAGIILSSYPATPKLSQFPEIGRLPGIVLGIVATETIPLHW
jgi:hypothetical protein